MRWQQFLIPIESRHIQIAQLVDRMPDRPERTFISSEKPIIHFWPPLCGLKDVNCRDCVDQVAEARLREVRLAMMLHGVVARRMGGAQRYPSITIHDHDGLRITKCLDGFRKELNTSTFWRAWSTDGRRCAPPILRVRFVNGFNPRELSNILRTVAGNRDLILRAWHDRFGN
jgi:hypothetical protein